jgi:aminopeptidase N
MDNHFWFPCYDFPNDRATSEVIATVRSGYTVLSNGRLVGTKHDTRHGTTTYHWKQARTHASYLIMLAIGEYRVLRDRVGSLPLEYYVYPGQEQDARVCFQETPQMVRFFEEYAGFTYPWEKYAQVLIHEFVAGGMEHTSATSLMDDATVFDARARVDQSPVSLIAHELAHQWWGDVVTCKDWRHLWLNESFASYFDPLYHEHTRGVDEFAWVMYNAQNAGMQSDRMMGRKPIVSIGSYGANLYPRGASVLHMLRFLLGDEPFRRGLSHYIRKHQFQVVETHDLEVALEEATGQNLYWFFEQWVYGAGYPIFEVQSAFDDTARAVRLSVRQVQVRDSLTGVFRTPVEVALTMAGSTAVHRVNISSADTTFVFPAASRPQMVIFDNGNWLLKELRFSKEKAEWIYQAERAPHVIDRVRAIKELADRTDNADCGAVLSRIAQNDGFWAVRREAVSALGEVQDTTPEGRAAVRETLLRTAGDKKSTVRVAALDQLRLFPGLESVAAFRAALQDSSYEVIAAALRGLARVDSAHAASVLLAYLDSASHRNTLAVAALYALRDVDSACGLAEARTRLRYGEPTSIRYAALGIVNRAIRSGVLPPETLFPLLQDATAGIRISAIRALGDRGGEDAIPPLERIAADKRNAGSAQAQRSIDAIGKRLKEPQK